jgi:NitT/TauT family transport system permease protein
VSRGSKLAAVDRPASVPSASPPQASVVAHFLRRLRRPIPSLLVLVVFVGVWELITRTEFVHPIILPPPRDVAAALRELVSSGELQQHLLVTTIETIGGFLVGSAAGFLLAWLAVSSPLANRALRPFIILLQATPKIALAPLLITWFGFGPLSKVAQSALLTFFPVFINSDVGLSIVDEDSVRLMRSLKASRWQTFIKLRLPSALPAIFAGLRTGLTFSLIGAVVSEMIGAREGLGLILVRYQAGFDIPLMYAVIFVMGMLGLVLFLAISFIDRRVVFWRDKQQGIL